MGGSKGKAQTRTALAARAEQAANSAFDSKLGRLLDQGNFKAAELRAHELLTRNPRDQATRKALSAALIHLEKLDEALVLCRELVELRPSDWECWANLAFVERNLDGWPAAIAAYHKALELKPGLDQLCAELAQLYGLVNHNEPALYWWFEALKAKPDSKEYFFRWVAALEHLRKSEEALGCLDAAWADEPGDPLLALEMIPSAMSMGEWQLLDEAGGTFKQRLEAGHVDRLAPLVFLALPWADRVIQYHFIRKQMEENLANGFLHPNYVAPASRESCLPPARRLRIGYLSADLFNHATTYLINGVLLAHAGVGLDLYLYSYGPNDEKGRRKELEAGAVVFRDVRMQSPKQAAELIAKDDIDILVDLKGWTKDYRPEIQAYRPAPVIVSWLGYPGTLGHRVLADYIIGDPTVTPLEHADGYAEWIAQMPYCYQPNDNRRTLPPALTRSEAGLPETGVVFCSFNRINKLTRAMFLAWCRILLAVPGSVLWMLSDFPRAQNNLRRIASEAGVDPQRLIFAPPIELEPHLARLQCADIALDSFPYTSHTTGSDALWAGVPLLALEGETFASRVSASLVQAVGLPELVTHNLEEFEAQAIRLANTPELLKGIRAKLASNRAECALFDTQGFAKDLARLYEQIWQNYTQGRWEHISLKPRGADTNRQR